MVAGNAIILLVVSFLLPWFSADAAENVNSLNLRIPEGTAVAGTFQEGRSLRDEYDLLSMITFIPGVHPISLATGQYSLDLIERFESGPERQVAKPISSGSVTVKIMEGNPASVQFRFEQNFDVNGTHILLFIDNLGCNIVNGKPEIEELVFDEPFLSKKLYMMGQIKTAYQFIFLKFVSLGYDSLPLYKLELTLENNQTIQLYQRWQPALAGTGPARLVLAIADMQGKKVIQNSYWKLIYSAEHHNWNEKFWMLFDNPIGDAYGIAVVTEDYPSNVEVYTLDQNLEPLRNFKVLSSEKKSLYRCFSTTQYPAVFDSVLGELLMRYILFQWFTNFL